ncbi:MAG: translocation/assembly module TamB domain-containing protein [Elusimicrobiota bacterium]
MGRKPLHFALLAAAMAAVAGPATAALRIPGPFVEKAASWLEARTGVRVEVGGVSGSPAEGLVLHDVELSWPAGVLAVPRLAMKVDAKSLLRKRVIVTSLALTRPTLRLKPPGETSLPDSSARKKPAWIISLLRASIQEGAIIWEPPSAILPGRIERLDARLRVDEERVHLESATWRMAGREMNATGTVGFAPLSVNTTLRWDRDIEGSFRWTRDAEGWKANAEIKKRRKPSLSVAARSDKENAWHFQGNLARLDPADLMIALPFRIAPVSGDLQAKGGGPGPGGISAGLFDLQEEGGLRLQAKGHTAEGRTDWRVELSTAGASASSLGSFESGVVRATWTLEADAAAIRRLAGTWAAGMRAAGSVSGTWPALRWRAEGRMEGLDHETIRLSSAAFTAAGRGLRPAVMDVRVVAAGLRAGAVSLDEARVSLSGSTSSHTTDWEAAVSGGTLAARGSGALAGGVWTVRWKELQAYAGRVYRSSTPFKTEIGSGAWSVSSLAVSDGKARLAVDAAARGTIFERLRMTASGFDPAFLRHIGVRTVPLDGEVDAAIELKGALSAPSGKAAFRLRDGHWRRRPLGDISGRLSSDGKTLRVETLLWESGGGTLTLRGTAPLAFGGGETPDFLVDLEADGFDPAPLAAWSDAIVPESSRLSGRMRVGRRAGAPFCDGEAALRAEAVRIPAAGITLTGVTLSAVGEGRPALSLRGSAVPLGQEPPLAGLLRRVARRLSGIFERKIEEPRGTLTLSGEAGLDGPDLLVSARNLPFRSEAGLSGEADLDVGLKGAWKALRVGGTIALSEAEFMPPPKKPEAPASPRAPARGARELKASARAEMSPLQLDLRVRFDRNAWFRQGASDIETKGELLVKKEQSEPARILGAVRTLQGRYVIYGRPFDIREGRAEFSGAAPPDPTIDVRAVYVDQGTRAKVFLDLSGTASRPVVSLSSEPPMEQRDIISMLTLGKPVYDLGSESDSKKKREEAARLFTEYVSRSLHRHVIRKAKIDTFQVRARGAREADVTAGKYLTKRLFVTYGQTLGPAGQRRVEARYTLSPRWSLEGRDSSDGTYVIDILLNFAFR